MRTRPYWLLHDASALRLTGGLGVAMLLYTLAVPDDEVSWRLAGVMPWFGLAASLLLFSVALTPVCVVRQNSIVFWEKGRRVVADRSRITHAEILRDSAAPVLRVVIAGREPIDLECWAWQLRRHAVPIVARLTDADG